MVDFDANNDLKNVIDTASSEGELRGELRGILKVAKAMKDAGIAIDIIIKTTGLSEKETEQL